MCAASIDFSTGFQLNVDHGIEEWVQIGSWSAFNLIQSNNGFKIQVPIWDSLVIPGPSLA